MKPTYYRRIIRITAEDSPNVRLALAQIKAGKEPTGEVIIPGVMPWFEYRKRLTTWDEVRVCIGLRAEFYEGAEYLLIPPAWVAQCVQQAVHLSHTVKKREAKAIGVDPGQGKANSSMSVVDEYGLLEQVSRQTPDTSDIQGELVALGRKWNVPSEYWMLDAGGGGKQIADRMRADGHKGVCTVAFGEVVQTELRRGMTPFHHRLNVREAKKAYVNRRSQMYGDLAALMDPTAGVPPFAIPGQYTELLRQLSLIPKKYDSEGRLRLPPKGRRSENSGEVTMTDILGASPDEADSLVIGVHCMVYGGNRRVTAGVPDSTRARRSVNVHQLGKGRR